jgi:hypothetical protein
VTDSGPDLFPRPRLHREPLRSAFLAVVLAILASALIPVFRGLPDQYAFQHISSIAAAVLLLLGYVGSAYATGWWRGVAATAGMALCIAVLVRVFVR